MCFGITSYHSQVSASPAYLHHKGGVSLISFLALRGRLLLSFALGKALLEMSLPGSSDGKASVYNAGDPGLIPGLGRSPGEGNGSPLQYSCLENPTDGGAW